MLVIVGRHVLVEGNLLLPVNCGERTVIHVLISSENNHFSNNFTTVAVVKRKKCV